MPDALEQVASETIDELLKEMPTEERLKGLSAEERLTELSLDDFLAGLSLETREAIRQRLRENDLSSSQ